METQKAYKLLYYNSLDCQRYSWNCVVRANADFNVLYKPNELIKPRIGKLFVFDSVDSVNQALVNAKETELWEVEAYNTAPCDRVLDWWKLSNRLVEWWLAGANPKEMTPPTNIAIFGESQAEDLALAYLTRACPAGTLTCDSLKLIRQLPINKNR